LGPAQDLLQVSLSFTQLMLRVGQIRSHVVEPAARLDDVDSVGGALVDQVLHLLLESREWSVLSVLLFLEIGHLCIRWIRHLASSSERLD
jgi:hypothetical protein